ncbi:CHAT domain-containing protein [Marinoscillum pacificum]|uniref:CHAT domain-containing protein n=1 Tax=Marinoscillum pacificum TaxID=392723 RepID=UPI002157941A|nr:CHAT domain-containing protein [Marinoscillum pacificum]
MVRIAFSSLLTILCLGMLMAQTPFKDKKDKKFYDKIDKLYNNGDYEKILDNEEAIITYVDGRQDTVAAVMNFFLGDSYLMIYNDLETSSKFFRKEYELRKLAGYKDEAFTQSAFNLGYILDEMGYYKETEDIYLELLEIEEASKGKKSQDYYVTASSLMEHYMYTNDYTKGLELVKDLKKVVDKNTINEAMLLKYEGDYLEMSGSYKKSEKALQKSLEILDENGMYASVEYVGVLSSVGGLYSSMGKIPVAEEAYREALSILDRLPSDYSDYKLAVRGNLASVLYILGNYDAAEEIYVENLKQDAELFGEESFYYGSDAYSLAVNYVEAGKYKEAEQKFTEAAAIFKDILGEESIYSARVLEHLTELYTKTRQLDKAIESGKKAIAIIEKVSTDPQQIAIAYYYLGDAYFAEGEIEEAASYHKKALEIREKGLGKSHSDYAQSTNKMAILNWNKKLLDDAKKLYQETFDNYFAQINTIFPILSEEEKAKFYYNKLRPTFEQYNSFIVETSIEEKELIGEMYNYQLATKGLILSATNKVRESIMSSGNEQLIVQYEEWVEQKEKLAKLFSTSDMPVEIRNVKIDSLTKLADDLERALSKESADFKQTFANRDLKWQDIQAKLKPGEAAVEVVRFRDFTPDSAGVFTDEVYYAALIVTSETKDYPDLVLMRNGKMMETRYLSNYRNAIKYKIDEDFSYKLFWKPIANRLEGVKKVYFSPDGVFNQISIYTLRNSATGNFTLDELEIHVMTNTKDLVAFNGSSNPGNKSYLFGYPNYNMGAIDQKREDGGSTDASKITQAAKEDRSVRGASRGVRGSRGGDDNIESLSRGGAIPRGLRGNLLRYMRSNQMLALLPGTKREVNLIDSLYNHKALPATTYLSNDALEDSIKKLDNPRTLHIATHGFFLENDHDDEQTDEYVQNPLLRSGLILAGANSFISEGQISNQIRHDEDGILTAYEAMNLKLDGTELVVLSACETGLGEVKNGEGVYGLQRAFQVAGADAIIMSMWTVDDDATQELMTIFYEEWLSGKNKQDAFITAQKRLKDKWKSPYYWGAFVMIGN